ncbi:MAG: ABC transporter ATP-binding protein [Spirochaetales bacterium]|nr:ABC transporter ATP-binding protein [Spirochaetales bacterium]
MDYPVLRLLPYIRSDGRLFSLAFGASVLNKILDLMPPVLVGWVIDSLANKGPAFIHALAGGSSLALALVLGGLGIGIFLGESIFQWLYQKNFMLLAQKVQHRLRVDTYDRLQQREIAFFENQRTGETMAMLGDDINQLERFLNNGFNDILQLFIMCIFASFVFFSTSLELAVAGLLPVPLIIWGSVYYRRLIGGRYARVRKVVGELFSRLENNISGMLVIKSFTAEKWETERVSRESKAYQEANYDAIRLSALYVPIIRMVVAMGFGAVLSLGSYRILTGSSDLTAGQLVLFGMLIQRVLWPLTRLGQTFDEFERANASARRTFGLFDARIAIRSPENPERLENTKGRITFDNVYFSYRPELPVLQGLSFDLPPGAMLGVAGTTGAGKSTLVKLLLRLYDPERGKILLDSVPLTALDLEFLRQQIALVSQDVYLFHGSIRENIAYGLTKADEAKIRLAARQAAILDFIDELPEGLDTLVGERGIKLSGGQRQRLSLARALLKDAPILVLDEATSSVDTETERLIQDHLFEFAGGRTTIVVAHRLSTIKHADSIIVIDRGRVVEAGNHQELVALDRIYADLWRVQIGNGSFGLS